MSAAAEEQPSHTIVFYAIGVALDGVITVGDTSVENEVSASELLERLDLAAMGSYRYRAGPWMLQVDTIYASLAGEEGIAQGNARARMELDQTMIEVDGGYRVHENIELIAGVRCWEYETGLRVSGAGGTVRRLQGDESWADPLIGARVSLPIGSNWQFVGRGDIGGFGVGSDFAWHLTAYFDWRLREHFGLLFGYRIFDVDFEDGSGAQRIGIDLQQGGPAVGVSFAF